MSKLRLNRHWSTRPPFWRWRGTSLNNVVMTTIFYTDVENFATINTIYAGHMPEPPPARSAPTNVFVPHGLLTSIDAIATIMNPES